MAPLFVNSFFKIRKYFFQSPMEYARGILPILFWVIKMKQWKEWLLAALGGGCYVLLELLWRGRSHWTMFVLGGLCFQLIGCLNRRQTMPLALQACLGAMIVTALELLTGITVNLLLDWNVWDYSALPANFLGQICLYYFVLWIPISAAAALAGNWLRHRLFGAPMPQIRLFRWREESNPQS